MKRTRAGLTHGEPPALPPHLVITLKAGWALQPDHRSFADKRQHFVPPLPSGAWLEPAMPMPPRRRPTSPAEADLLRYVHLRLPAGADTAAALALVRGWPGVERAEPAPQISLP